MPSKLNGTQRINISFDAESLRDLDWLSALGTQGNRSRMVRQLIADSVALQLKGKRDKSKKLVFVR